MAFAPAGRVSLMGLWKQGWNEIPEVMGAGCFYLLGLGIMAYKVNREWSVPGANHKTYKAEYIVYRSSHPYEKYRFNRDSPEALARYQEDAKPYACSPYNKL